MIKPALQYTVCVATVLVSLACGQGSAGVDNGAPTSGPESSTPSGPESSTPGTSPASATAGVADTLPIEVLGPKGFQVSMTIELREAGAAPALLVQCHGCGYQDIALDSNPSRTKASVQVNGGALIPLKHYTGQGALVGNPDLEVLGSSATYGGIGGPLRTVRFLLPVQGLVAGRNVVTFHHSEPALESLGFRIVELDVVERGTPERPSLLTAALPHDDPSTWRPPLPSANALEEGRVLWSKRDQLHDPAFDALDGQAGGPPIHAACADCHARDGRDLKYFNFSTPSIVARSQFHGLSAEEGAKIASYIRALDVPLAPRAHPWNPPYQPGPGLDARPAHEWAAGAGLEWVLQTDDEVRGYLFPGGPAGATAERVAAIANRFSTLNMRELPVALQLPDWNQWLPRIHPLDAFDTNSAVIRQDEKGDDVAEAFFEAAYREASVFPTSETISKFRERMETWLGRGATCYSQTEDGGPDYRAVDAKVFGSIALPPANQPVIRPSECDALRHAPERMRRIEQAKVGLVAWVSVKQWELVHTNRMEEESQTAGVETRVGGRVVDASEPRGWGLRGYSVFSRAPHFVGYDSRNFTYQDEMSGRYDSTAWYHLQLVLNPGYRRSAPPPDQPNHPDPPMPSHAPYTLGFIEALAAQSGAAERFRFWATYIKIRQQQTNGRYGVENGLDLRTAQPYMLYSDATGSTQLRDVGQPLWGRVASAMLLDLTGDAANEPGPANQGAWERANANSVVQQSMTCAEYTFFDFSSSRANPFVTPKPPKQGTNTYRAISQLRDQVGVEDVALTALLAWANDMWPPPASCSTRWTDLLP